MNISSKYEKQQQMDYLVITVVPSPKPIQDDIMEEKINQTPVDFTKFFQGNQKQ